MSLEPSDPENEFMGWLAVVSFVWFVVGLIVIVIGNSEQP